MISSSVVSSRIIRIMMSPAGETEADAHGHPGVEEAAADQGCEACSDEEGGNAHDACSDRVLRARSADHRVDLRPVTMRPVADDRVITPSLGAKRAVTRFSAFWRMRSS